MFIKPCLKLNVFMRIDEPGYRRAESLEDKAAKPINNLGFADYSINFGTGFVLGFGAYLAGSYQGSVDYYTQPILPLILGTFASLRYKKEDNILVVERLKSGASAGAGFMTGSALASMLSEILNT
jgi:hypothetical protein